MFVIVKVENGDELIIPYGAYKEFYAPRGLDYKPLESTQTKEQAENKAIAQKMELKSNETIKVDKDIKEQEKIENKANYKAENKFIAKPSKNIVNNKV